MFNGRAVVPFGGELQYFRVRDPGGDPVRTQEIWEETIDRMAEAGLNLVSTYVPWDFHEPAPGTFDFAGDRDLPHFLELCARRGFLVLLKPGPCITAEWPEGFGTFGAVPAWFRARHPEALVRTPKGEPWSFHPLGRRDQVQPRYDHPVFLRETRRWFAALAPIVKRFIHDVPAIAMLQLDNETNCYWSDLGHLEGLCDYDERQRHCVEYLARLKDMWREVGVGDDDVLFTANDSPFPIPGRRTLLPCTPRKSAVGLPTLDTYPRALPLPGRFADQPFQAPYFTKLFQGWTGYAFAAEIQAMELTYPLGLRASCAPEVTGQHLTHMFGSGLKGGAMYIMREGLNANGTLYAPGAPLTLQGQGTARLTIVEAFATMLRRHGEALVESSAEGRIAVVTHPALASDPETRGRLWAIEAPAVFGWLRLAGYDPDAVCASHVTAADLARYAGLAAVGPDLWPAADRAKLGAFAGTLLEMPFAGHQPFAMSLPGSEDGITPLASVPATCASGALRAFASRGAVNGGEPFLTAASGEVLGTRSGKRWTLATRVASALNRSDLYAVPDDELRALRDLARAIFAPLAPAVPVDSPRVEAWRRGPFVFLVNHGPATVVRSGTTRARCAFTGEARDPSRLALPDFGWAILIEDHA